MWKRTKPTSSRSRAGDESSEPARRASAWGKRPPRVDPAAEPVGARSGTVTRVALQTRSGAERVNVFLDGEYAFSLAADLAYQVHEGDAVEEAAVEELIRQDDAIRAYGRALIFMAPRPRSVAEVRTKLAQQGHKAPAIDATLQKLAEQHLINDEEFAGYWVSQRQTFRPRGARALEVELRRKGIDRETAGVAIAAADIDQVAAAVRAGSRTAAKASGEDERAFAKTVGAFLLRRGFDYGTAKEATQALWVETQQAERA